MSTRVVILGAGFAGLELSSRLSAELADEVDVTLIDQSDSFMFGFSKLEVMFSRKMMDQVRIPYRAIAKPGVTFPPGGDPVHRSRAQASGHGRGRL